jgi:type VI secretion system secreted protein Hcp
VFLYSSFLFLLLLEVSMTIVRKSVGIVCGAAAVGLLVIVWGLNAGPLDPSAPPASTMKSMQELYDLTSSMKGAALPAPLFPIQTDMFMQVVGIPGESSDRGHEKWIDLIAFHWGVSRPGRQFPIEGRPPTPVADHADLTIVKQIDKSSPKLFLACCSGQTLGEVNFEVWRSGERPTRILLYRMKDVIVTSVKPVGASVGTSPYLMEEIGFNYAKIEVGYTAIKPDGTPEGEIIVKWDRQTNASY